MKKHIIIVGWIFSIFFTGTIFAQNYQDNDPVMPLKSSSSILFGKDILINDNSGQDQRNVVICSAYNGCLYAAYSYNNSNKAYVSLSKSVDNGLTWDSISGGAATTLPHKIITRLVIMACGNSSSNFKFFFGYVYYDTVDQFSIASVYRFNPDPFTVEQQIFHKEQWSKQDITVASDYLYPANNSDPYSISILNSSGVSSKDSLNLYLSSNGGMSIDKSTIVSLTTHKFQKVTLSYGRSLLWSSGRYFAAWEEQDNVNSDVGHIYTAHSEPNFDSPFTNPICLDSLNVSSINNSRNPVISCQSNNADNDSANLTEIVMFETFLPSVNNYDFKGYCNVQATSSKYFKEFNVASSSNIKLQPDITFNPYNSHFLLTYFDPALYKLPYLTKDVNLVDPNNWNVVNPGYNDSTNISLPNPKIALNTSLSDAICTWVANRETGYGEAFFDAPYSTYTGSLLTKFDQKDMYLKLYPNPCSNSITMIFELERSEEVTITLYSIMGQVVKEPTSQYYKSGKHFITIDFTGIEAGTYLYSFVTEHFSKSGKIIINR